MNSPEITCTGETCDVSNGTKPRTFSSGYASDYQTQGLCPSSTGPLQQNSSSFGCPRYCSSSVPYGPIPKEERMVLHTKEIPCPITTVKDTPPEQEDFVKSSSLSSDKKVIVLHEVKKKAIQFEALALYLQRGSLEFFKDGLLTSCFIIFFDFWCEFLKHDDAMAHTFFNEYHRIFLPEHVMDITEMKQITHFHQIKNAEHLQIWIEKNIKVSISPLSYRLLLIFLSEPDYASMLHCVITRIQFLITNDDKIDFTKEDVYYVKTYLNKKSLNDDSFNKNTKKAFPDMDSSCEEKEPFVLNWGLLSGQFNKVKRLETTDKVPEYLESDRPFLALINGEITQPVDPNLALPLTNESKWALDSWYQYHLDQTSRTMYRDSLDNFPSILSFNLDCVTDELTVVKLSHWSSSPWLLAARQSGAIGLWDLPTLLKASQQTRNDDNVEPSHTLSENAEEEKKDQDRNISLPQLLISHTCSVTALAFVPPATPNSAVVGPTLREQNCLSASADGTIRLWNLPKATALASYSPYQIPLYSLDVSPFGNFFVSGGGQGLSCMYSFSREYPLRVFTSHKSDVLVTKCSPNSLLVASGSMDAFVKLWDIRTAKPLVSLKYKTSPIRNVAFSPNGRLLSSYFHSQQSSTIVVWDIGTQKMLGYARLPAQVGHATSMAFCYGSHTLLIACSYGALVQIVVDHLLHSSRPSTCVENFMNGEKSYNTFSSSCQMSIIPLGQRLAADIVFTPENVAAICSIPMTNNCFIPSL